MDVVGILKSYSELNSVAGILIYLVLIFVFSAGGLFVYDVIDKAITKFKKTNFLLVLGDSRTSCFAFCRKKIAPFIGACFLFLPLPLFLIFLFYKGFSRDEIGLGILALLGTLFLLWGVWRVFRVLKKSVPFLKSHFIYLLIPTFLLSFSFFAFYKHANKPPPPPEPVYNMGVEKPVAVRSGDRKRINIEKSGFYFLEGTDEGYYKKNKRHNWPFVEKANSKLLLTIDNQTYKPNYYGRLWEHPFYFKKGEDVVLSYPSASYNVRGYSNLYIKGFYQFHRLKEDWPRDFYYRLKTDSYADPTIKFYAGWFWDLSDNVRVMIESGV